MIENKVIKGKFTVMADYGFAWGWTTEYFKDGTECCQACSASRYTTEIDNNGGEVAKLDADFVEEICQWQNGFEGTLYNPVFDWEAFNKQGEKLTEKLKQQIGHLFDEVVYEVPWEYEEYLRTGLMPFDYIR